MADLIPAPLITPEQLALEAVARELWENPRVKAALAKAKALMRSGFGMDIPAEAQARFDSEMDEYGVCYVTRVLCRDRNNFCLNYSYHPAYRRPDGTIVPACRFYGENPDAVYRWGGLHSDRRYRLIGKRAGPPPLEASFTMMGTYGGTMPGDNINLSQLVTEPDGGFVITIDTEPANGRANHLRMLRGTRLLLVREFTQDWEIETPLSLALEAEGVERGGPWDIETALEDICFHIVEDMYLYFWMIHIYRNLQPNSLAGPAAAAAMGGSATMATCQGFFQIEDDEAVLFEWDTGGALLSSLSALDWWYIPIAAHRIQSSLNSAMAVPNADGTISAVLSARDPGIANWLDTNGLRNVLLTGRWQSLPVPSGGRGPRLSARLVKLAELEQLLPPDVARCSPEERADRYARRLAAYTRRTGNMRNQFLE